VARRTGLTDDQVRAALGAAFFALSVVYVVKTVRELLGSTGRDEDPPRRSSRRS
jgi:hypothetical protein